MHHGLSTEQLRKFVDAIGGLKDFPAMTDDPVVNHAIDCIVADPCDEPEYNDRYRKEVDLFKARIVGR